MVHHFGLDQPTLGLMGGNPACFFWILARHHTTYRAGFTGPFMRIYLGYCG
jgi:hypothetical protein